MKPSYTGTFKSTMKSVRFGVFADTHFQTGKKLQPGVSAFAQVMGQMLNGGVKFVVFLGDFFDARYQIDVEVANAVIGVMKSFGNWQIPVYMVAGNHDMVNDTSVTSLSLLTLSPKWRLECGDMDSGYGFSTRFVPYMKFPNTDNQLLSVGGDTKIVFMHQAVLGFPLPNECMVVAESIDTAHIPENVELIIAGHNHRPHHEGRVLQAGAIMNLDYGDGNQPRGCWIVDTAGTVEFYETSCPKYITVRSMDEVKQDGNHYRVILSEDELRSVVSMPENAEIRVESKQQVVDRLQLGNTWSLPTAIEKYVERNGKDVGYAKTGKELIGV
jgi:DNA repair exonuclease SbcCD nuclease subunit